MEVGGPSSPPIPPRTHQTPNYSRRRRVSAAKSTIDASTSASNINAQSPAPEVISSLISSLEAISTPAEHRFDQLPPIASNKSKSSSLTSSYRPSSVSPIADPRDRSRSPPVQQSFGVDYGAYKHPEEVDQESYLIANTAYSPVVRMAKPRAGSSSSKGRAPILKLSRQSLRSVDEAASIGQLSTSPGLQPSSASIASSTKSGRISRILGRRKSREAPWNGQSERLSADGRSGGAETLSPLSNGLRHSSSRRHLAQVRIDETSAGLVPSPPPPRTPPQDGPSSLRLTVPGTSLASDPPGGIGSGRSIPSRQSSLLHDPGSNKVKRSSKSSSQKHGDKNLRNEQDAVEEDDSTVKRIRELQKQKERREKDERREERRAEKRARNSMPGAAPPQRTVSNPNLRHSMAEVITRVPDPPALPGGHGAPAPAVSRYNSRRASAGPPPFNVGNSLRATTGSVKYETRSSGGSRPVTPTVHQRAMSETQYSPGRASLGLDRTRSANSIDDAVDAYLASPRLTQRIRHPETGRIIAFAEVGDPRGFPVICCVGMGMTRFITAFYDELALTLKLRLITIDRPGVGQSEPCSDGTAVPLKWPDDLATVCNALSITKFSLIAHSAGAIYALATALRLPQHIRGRLHLLAPWIPPSQIASVGSQNDAVPSNSIPYSQKLLRVLPASFLRAANSSFISSATSSLVNKSPRRSKRKGGIMGNGGVDLPSPSNEPFVNRYSTQQPVFDEDSLTSLTDAALRLHSIEVKDQASWRGSTVQVDANFIRARQSAYDDHLTQRIWDLAQRHANPAVDLLICLERRQTIGFRYVDITRPCVIHHGSRDSRVPVENVKWLAKKMRRCEIRVLEGEGHSLMANAKIMAEVLTEVGREWEEWSRVTRNGKGRRFLPAELEG